MNRDEIVALGASLRQVSKKLMKSHQDSAIARLWYQGGEPYFDVFFEVKEDQIIWFQFTLRGQSLTWSQKHPQLETGLTHEKDMEGSRYAASKIIKTDHALDGNFISLAREILETRSQEFPFTQALSLLER